MFGKALTFTRMGLNCDMVEAEVDIKNGLPAIFMAGLLSQEVKESKERIRPAIQNSGFEFPVKKITINLSPAEISKTGTHYDLSIAMAILSATGVIDSTDGCIFFGELNLSGEIKWVRGIFPMVIEALKKGYNKIFIPYDNLSEIEFINLDKIIPVKTLNETADIIINNNYDTSHITTARSKMLTSRKVGNYSDIMEQRHLIDAFTIAASGGHHMIIVGPPGSGKTMAASRLPSIMPDLTSEEFMEINKIYSVAAENLNGSINKIRPFRNPHNSASSRAVIGGGAKILPGEVSLAHKGVLFLDEFLEFHSDSLQSLRTIIENKEVYISLRNGCAIYPADFLLVAACNPCACGFYGTKSGTCICTKNEIKKYRKKLNNPLVDRIDLQVKVDRLNYQELINGEKNVTSESIKAKVIKCYDIQQKRYRNEKFKLNSAITPDKISQYCIMEKGGNKTLEKFMEDNLLTARSCHKILKISRTIADLRENEIISVNDINKAVSLRFLDTEVV
ncbi:MAG TPA: YifB family Mg chelatase-like AAA ATPase [Spirochaetota bacterium]|nr:MAG: Competence protein ComM [Spirochaetes bacterium ADurb.Bin133]HNZ26960.1 YifB family Mg chelatase-like AAA ATPase [Spirochaetota bacterium]HPY88791.1 YifB family Mg chelatase-like AAA ATPase [Spirochaetota bacterium]HQB60418.1 YifB family Mg chelatase-like AAA ATPase [Spirochaetota bacterium]